MAAISEMPPHPSPVLWRPFLNKLVFVALPPTEPEPIKPACLFNRSASELWDFDALKGNINLDRLSSYQVLINWTVSCRWPDQVVSQFLKQCFKWLHSLRKLTLVFYGLVVVLTLNGVKTIVGQPKTLQANGKCFE